MKVNLLEVFGKETETPASAAIAPGQPASISGQVLRLNGKPLAKVTLRVGPHQTRTGNDGEFLLEGVTSGSHTLVIDGRSANQGQVHYGRFEYRLDVKPGHNDLDFTIWMPRLDTRHTVKIPAPTDREIVVTHPDMPGLELRIPPGSVVRDANGKIATEVGFTPIPLDQLPFPMPYTDVPLFFSIQPGGAVIESVAGPSQGATLVYPNYSSQPPGAKIPLFDYDPKGRGWFLYSTGVVAKDGDHILTDKEFRVYQFTAKGVWAGGVAPAKGPMQNESCRGDPIACRSGLFLETITDISLSDIIPAALRRTYRQNDPNSRSFGVGESHNYDWFLTYDNQPATDTDTVEVILAHGGRIRFKSTDGKKHSILRWVYESVEIGEFYKARVSYQDSNIVLQAKDGRKWGFYGHGRLAWIQDRAGNRLDIWREDIRENVGLIVTPNGRYLEFSYTTPGCYNCISQVTDSTGRAVAYEYDDGERLTKVSVPISNDQQTKAVTTYTYDLANPNTTKPMQTVKRPNDQASGKNTLFLEYRCPDPAQTLCDNELLATKEIFADTTHMGFSYTVDPVSGNITATDVTDEGGHKERLTYNADGHVLTDTLAFGTPIQQSYTFSRRSDAGFKNFIDTMTDALGRVTKYDYDDRGNITGVTRMYGTASAVTWTLHYEPTFNPSRYT